MYGLIKISVIVELLAWLVSVIDSKTLTSLQNAMNLDLFSDNINFYVYI